MAKIMEELKQKIKEAKIRRLQERAVDKIISKRVRLARFREKQAQSIKLARQRERIKVDRVLEREKAQRQMLPSIVSKLERTGKNVRIKNLVGKKKKGTRKVRKVKKKIQRLTFGDFRSPIANY